MVVVVESVIAVVVIVAVVVVVVVAKISEKQREGAFWTFRNMPRRLHRVEWL
jgi:hypothetical protein